ncbi:hypothetical protein MRX96_001377 [Rhipicephalus microplus]
MLLGWNARRFFPKPCTDRLLYWRSSKLRTSRRQGFSQELLGSEPSHRHGAIPSQQQRRRARQDPWLVLRTVAPRPKLSKQQRRALPFHYRDEKGRRTPSSSFGAPFPSRLRADYAANAGRKACPVPRRRAK